ncbi:hypothetical protein PFICI_07652 [Pestalotiopsis fici W106-1]|uniref:Uncharacterized protein n=1 Tax=Pestalotiopsis fici (strain W106-1 / CGMCC3.15140) TaxID=1229662 RepID=W3X1W5_PESFW|nr:uncharacterized protein PFICI_07652 [Pestalotiopsis fici W106-1]ETS80123.1 hypothetical protein PFICI_07652 [Pestalotiopsis fici W106-1]
MSSNYQPVGIHASNRHLRDEHYSVSDITDTDHVQLHDLPPYAYGQETKTIPMTAAQAGERQQQKQQRQRRARNSRLWMWELLASAFSLLCIAIVVIVLKYEDGKRLDGWALMIGPNAVISFITTLAKSSCLLVLAEVIGQLRWIYFAGAPRVLNDLHLFDLASRGPWGALELMFRMKSAALLASCASLLTIAALVIDPFAQLVLTFPTRPTATPVQVASINIAQVYDAGTEITANHGPPYPVAQNAPFQLQSAVISAAFGVAPAFDLNCPTSNCTYPSFSTLGVCSTCEDVTASTSTACGLDESNYTTICNTTVPYQLLPESNFTWHMATDAAGNYADLWNSSTMSVTPEYAGTNTSFGTPAILAAFTSFKLNRELFSSTASDRPSNPSSVNQCMFAYCLKTYSDVRVLNGETQFGSINESIMEVSSQEWFLDPPESQGSPYFTMQASVGGQVSGPNYTMNYWDHLNLGQYMRDVLNSSVYLFTNTIAPGDGGHMAPSFGLAMYNADNLTDMVHDIADSMTNSMRNSQSNVTTVNGTALVLETFIHIEWKWLALPIAVSVLSFVLLVTVMIISKSHNVEGESFGRLAQPCYCLEIVQYAALILRFRGMGSRIYPWVQRCQRTEENIQEHEGTFIFGK